MEGRVLCVCDCMRCEWVNVCAWCMTVCVCVCVCVRMRACVCVCVWTCFAKQGRRASQASTQRKCVRVYVCVCHNAFNGGLNVHHGAYHAETLQQKIQWRPGPKGDFHSFELVLYTRRSCIKLSTCCIKCRMADEKMLWRGFSVQ